MRVKKQGATPKFFNFGVFCFDMKKKIILWVTVLTIILLGISIFSICIGPTKISLKNIFTLGLPDKDSMEYSIIFNIRFPRIILGFAIGGAFSLA